MKKVINNFIEVFLFMINIVFIYCLIKINVIPTVYLIIIIGLIVVFDVISRFLLSKGKIGLTLGYIMLFINLVVSSIGIYYTFTTDNFL